MMFFSLFLPFFSWLLILADASAQTETISVSAVVALVVGILGGGGGGALLYRSHILRTQTDIMPQYALKEDVDGDISRLDGRIDEALKIQRDGERRVHARIDGDSVLLARVDAKTDILLAHFNIPSPKITKPKVNED